LRRARRAGAAYRGWQARGKGGRQKGHVLLTALFLFSSFIKRLHFIILRLPRHSPFKCILPSAPPPPSLPLSIPEKRRRPCLSSPPQARARRPCKKAAKGRGRMGREKSERN
jgi:hypothetical protein